MCAVSHDHDDLRLRASLLTLPGVRPSSISIEGKRNSWVCSLELELGMEQVPSLMAIEQVYHILVGEKVGGTFTTHRLDDVLVILMEVDFSAMSTGIAADLLVDAYSNWPDLNQLGPEEVFDDIELLALRGHN